MPPVGARDLGARRTAVADHAAIDVFCRPGGVPAAVRLHRRIQPGRRCSTSSSAPRSTRPNFNHWFYLRVNPRNASRDAMTYLRARPAEYAQSVLFNLGGVLLAVDEEIEPVGRHRALAARAAPQVLGRYEAAWNAIVDRLPFAPIGLYACCRCRWRRQSGTRAGSSRGCQSRGARARRALSSTASIQIGYVRRRERFSHLPRDGALSLHDRSAALAHRGACGSPPAARENIASRSGRNVSIARVGCSRLTRMPGTYPAASKRWMNERSRLITLNRHVVRRAVAGDVGRRLMIAEQDDQRIVVDPLGDVAPEHVQVVDHRGDVGLAGLAQVGPADLVAHRRDLVEDAARRRAARSSRRPVAAAGSTGCGSRPARTRRRAAGAAPRARARPRGDARSRSRTGPASSPSETPGRGSRGPWRRSSRRSRPPSPRAFARSCRAAPRPSGSWRFGRSRPWSAAAAARRASPRRPAHLRCARRCAGRRAPAKSARRRSPTSAGSTPSRSRAGRARTRRRRRPAPSAARSQADRSRSRRRTRSRSAARRRGAADPRRFGMARSRSRMRAISSFRSRR